ncbi:TetR-like C-terminal domain-containing protein [Streptomyces malaysiensis]|uniref:TetR-like C-terminal domain-containing protein n=1 Tax=Streptomyces malaysiensis TaxID=92644 RepID=UPI0037152B35
MAVAQLLSWPAKDPAVTEMQTKIWRDRIASAAKVVEQAIDRGEAPRNTDPRFIIELLVAPIHWRVLVLNEQLEPDLPAKLAQAVWMGSSDLARNWPLDLTKRSARASPRTPSMRRRHRRRHGCWLHSRTLPMVGMPPSSATGRAVGSGTGSP